MRRPNLLIAFCFLPLFVTGAIVGSFGVRLYTAKSANANARPVRLMPEEWRDKYMRDMQVHLNLTVDQMTSLNVILDETGSKVHAEHERHINQLKAIREEQVTQTRALLTSLQRPEYERLRKEREDRARNTRRTK